ncbi:hypothetical protein JTB14_009455 [Gonioctena quinquepunctata]|nr:hypothetical protein JTB14_009455 [Gonioctena quinquepunctata]
MICSVKLCSVNLDYHPTGGRTNYYAIRKMSTLSRAGNSEGVTKRLPREDRNKEVGRFSIRKRLKLALFLTCRR